MKIAIVEDNPKIRKTLQTRLENYPKIEVILVCINGKDCINSLKNIDTLPDIILMDIQMSEMDGIKTTHYISQNYPAIDVVMLTVLEDDEKILQAIRAGAKGYLLKDVNTDYLIQTLDEVQRGYSQLSPTIARKVLGLLQKTSQTPTSELPNDEKHKEVEEQLSKREIEILQFLHKGLRPRDVASQLFIETSTVQTHIRNIYKKLQVNSQIQLIQMTQGMKFG